MAKYASVKADLLRLGLSAAALDGVSLAQQEAALSSACTTADSFLSQAFKLPLVWTFLALDIRDEDGEGSVIDIFEAERVSIGLDIVSFAANAIEVEHTGTGSSVATVTGTATSIGEAIFEILSSEDGPEDGPTFRYSLDDGETYSDTQTLDESGVFEIPNTGLTITFSDASFIEDDTYSFSFGLSLSVIVEHSEDGETGWEEIGSFPIPEILSEAQHLSLSLGDNNLTLQRYLRISWTISGGSAEFGVSWDGDDLKAAVCAIASLNILKVRGFDPNGPDGLWQDEDKKYRGWLKSVHNGDVSPFFIDQTPAVEESKPYITSKRARGWT